jgi:hypothetical protein
MNIGENYFPEPAYQMEIFGVYEISFNESGILNINASNGYREYLTPVQTWELNYYFGTVAGIDKEFVNGETAEVIHTKYYDVNIDFTGTFDETKMEALSEFSGRVHDSPNIYDHSVVYVDLDIQSSASGTFGSPIQIGNLNNVNYELYWDRACTQKIETGETYGSFPKTIYVKATPQEGYALVKYLYRDNYGYSLENAGSGRKGMFVHELGENNIYEPTPAPLTKKIVKVTVDGVEVDFSSGIKFEENKVYVVEIYCSY